MDKFPLQVGSKCSTSDNDLATDLACQTLMIDYNDSSQDVPTLFEGNEDNFLLGAFLDFLSSGTLYAYTTPEERNRRNFTSISNDSISVGLIDRFGDSDRNNPDIAYDFREICFAHPGIFNLLRNICFLLFPSFFYFI